MIRDYVSSDADRIVCVWRKASALAHPFLTAGFMDEAEELIRNMFLPNAETFVADFKGTPIGFIAMMGNQIGGLFVDPMFHGLGVGRALVDHGVKRHGPLTVEVFEKNAIGRRFYDAYGFRQTGTRFDAFSKQPTLLLAMKP